MFTWIKRSFLDLLNKMFPLKRFFVCGIGTNEIPKSKFAAQKDIRFNKKTASWLLSNIKEAYLLICDGKPKPIDKLDTKKFKTLYAFTGTSNDLRTGYIANIEDGNKEINRVAIVIAGSTNIPEALEDFDYQQVPLFHDSPNGAKVSRGFYTFVTGDTHHTNNSLLDQIIDSLDRLKTKGKNEFYLVGHSLGGAAVGIIAPLLAKHFSKENDVDIIAYTFGAPRVGDLKFSNYVVETAEKSLSRFIFYRVFNTEDLTTSLPLPILPGKDSFFQHIEHFYDIEANDRRNIINDFSLTLNKGTYLQNQSPDTYIQGVEEFPIFK